MTVIEIPDDHAAALKARAAAEEIDENRREMFAASLKIPRDRRRRDQAAS